MAGFEQTMFAAERRSLVESGHQRAYVLHMADKLIRRKRTKLSEGDLFEFELPDGRLGYGIIVERGGLNNGRTPYLAIFRAAHQERPDLNQVIRGEVALAGWSMDALVYHGKWRVIAHGLPRPDIPLPNFKVKMNGKICVTDVWGRPIDEATPIEQELLDFKFSSSPVIFQDALEALHGFGDWQAGYDKLTPVHARQRVTRFET